MRSPWKQLRELRPDVDYLVLASSIPARHIGSTWRMFRGASAVRGQLASTDGVVGYSLLARPLHKDYATLSMWENQAALDAFTSASPHQELMTALAPEMGPTKFETWTIKGADGPPSWNEALDRLK